MITSFAILSLMMPEARAEDDAEPTEESDDELSRHRLPFEVLAERTIGTASTPVEFNWRRTKVQVAATGDQLYELNNFNSLRAGGMVRFPSSSLIVEVGASYVWVWDTPASRALAYTPYRQPGRPPRTEIDVNLGIPLAEGVVTAYPRYFPAAQLVLNGYFGLRYFVYPQGFADMTPREVGGALFSPILSETELANLEEYRLDAMQIDLARYGFMVGLGNDIYFKQGVFISPRAMFAVPLIAGATQTDLRWWADISLAVGVAF